MEVIQRIFKRGTDNGSEIRLNMMIMILGKLKIKMKQKYYQIIYLDQKLNYLKSHKKNKIKKLINQ